VQNVRKERDNDKAKRALGALKNAAKGSDNVMPKILDCARCYVTEGEMAETLKEVFGTYIEEPVF
jgi:methylmalonyl-CoA mutase N-terminal domain/subunit